MRIDSGAILGAISGLGYIVGIAGGIFYARSKVPGQTIVNYKALTESQEKRIHDLEDRDKVNAQNHLESVKAIADLSGQIKVYKELPLQEMSTAMQRISDTNQLILDTLRGDARLLADEKSLGGKKGPKIVTTVQTNTEAA